MTVNAYHKWYNQIIFQRHNIKTPNTVLIRHSEGALFAAEKLGNKYPMILSDKIKSKRNWIKKALEAEGVTGISDGYVCTHLLPMYQKKIAYGSKGYPWNNKNEKSKISYKKGICPVAEELHFESYLGFSIDLYDLNLMDIKLIIESFKRVGKRKLKF